MIFIDSKTDALIVVDIQNDFCPGGALAVAGGDEIIPALNDCVGIFQKTGSLILFSRDWHPEDSSHFKKWPPHCVQGTAGAEFHPKLAIPQKFILVSKGMTKKSDGYSCFESDELISVNGRNRSLLEVRLADYLRWSGVKRVFVGGLATDYCVKATAVDALKNGFKTYLMYDCCKAVEKVSGQSAVQEMLKEGARIALSGDFIQLLLEKRERQH